MFLEKMQKQLTLERITYILAFIYFILKNLPGAQFHRHPELLEDYLSGIQKFNKFVVRLRLTINKIAIAHFILLIYLFFLPVICSTSIRITEHLFLKESITFIPLS